MGDRLSCLLSAGMWIGLSRNPDEESAVACLRAVEPSPLAYDVENGEAESSERRPAHRILPSFTVPGVKRPQAARASNRSKSWTLAPVSAMKHVLIVAVHTFLRGDQNLLVFDLEASLNTG